MNYEQLKKYIDSGFSTHMIAKQTGKGQTTVLYWLNKFNLRTKFSADIPKEKWSERYEKPCKFCGKPVRNRNNYCNTTCQYNKRAIELGNRWKDIGESVLPDYSRKTGLLHGSARRFIFIINNFRCNRCGWTHDFGGNSLPPLEISHIDGNFSNNNLNNLELLCPNCHSVEGRINPVKSGKGRWSNGADSRNSPRRPRL